MGWIQDLAKPDPYFVLPVLLAVTGYFQTTLNPMPTDPMQAKMMKIMPVMFGLLTLFIPSGVTLYYFCNGVLSILQQWWINKNISKHTQKK
jgi:YidC/Oxa1 family membrane protein insertase